MWVQVPSSAVSFKESKPLNFLGFRLFYIFDLLIAGIFCFTSYILNKSACVPVLVKYKIRLPLSISYISTPLSYLYKRKSIQISPNALIYSCLIFFIAHHCLKLYGYLVYLFVLFIKKTLFIFCFKKYLPTFQSPVNVTFSVNPFGFSSLS